MNNTEEAEKGMMLMGEQLDSGTIETLARALMEQRRDGISIVLAAERSLRQLGRPVETAVRGREERRNGRLSEKVTQGV